MTNTKVSVLVPVYNVENFIHRCIDSILAQTFTDFECILVDDKSTDNSGYICDEYVKKDNRIKVIHKIKNEGLPQARKTGFECSCGDYIQFIDSDDYVEPDMLEKLYTYSITNNYDILCFDWYLHNEINDVIYNNMINIPCDYIQIIKKIILDIGMNGAVWNKFFLRSIIKKIEFPKRNFFEDKYITAQIFFYAKNIGYINSAFYHYIYNINSIMNNPKKKIERTFDEINNLNKIIYFLKKNNYKNLKIFDPELYVRKKRIKDRLIKGFKYLINRKITA